MASTFAVSRAHLIYGVCLPLAVLLGYVLAEPLDSGSMAVVTLVICVLSVPLVMRWHHPLLVFSCNAWIAFAFLPGRPPLWVLMAFASLSLSMLNRSLGMQLRFFQARAVSISLLALGAVALATAFMNGGVGFGFLGGSNFGGKKYIFLFSAIMLYFALAVQPIPRHRAKFFIGLFFLSSLVPLIFYLAALGGPGFNFLAFVFPMQVTEPGVESVATAVGDFGGAEINRFTDFAEVARGILCYLLARHGARGLLDLSRPWRMGFFVLAIIGSLYSGFRSSLMLFPLTFALMYYFEGLLRTRYTIALIVGLGIGAAVLIPNVTRLPLSMQRALSFLPINVDQIARDDAVGSTRWRVQMWTQMLPDIPKYLIKGRGYSINPDDIYLVHEAATRGSASTYDVAIVAGDYHSGPLSVIIPFGLAGVIAFLWFLGASVNTLYRNFRYGSLELKTVNVLLLAYFIVQIFLFFFVFGSLYSDLLVYASVMGISVGLNGGVAKPVVATPESTLEEEAE